MTIRNMSGRADVTGRQDTFSSVGCMSLCHRRSTIKFKRSRGNMALRTACNQAKAKHNTGGHMTSY